jgi:hypothetical protein
VRALAAEQLLIPATACLDVAHADERLWMHKNLGLHADRKGDCFLATVKRQEGPGGKRRASLSGFG